MKKPTQKQIAARIQAAIENDPFAILAAQLYKEGIREGDLSMKVLALQYCVPEPYVLKVCNFLRDIERGR
jgi:hypothetical protein